MSEASALTETLTMIEEETSGSKVRLEEVVTALNSKGFGPLLMAPAMMVLLPTGSIPGVPAICGIFIMLVTGQIMVGRHNPWMPEKLKNMTFKRRKFMHAIDKTKPYTRFIDRFVHPRFDFCAMPFMQRIIAAICFVFALLMVVIGFVPFIPTILSIPILFFAVGQSAKDGIMSMCGFIFSIGVLLVILNLSGSFNGQGDEALRINAVVFKKVAPVIIDMNALD